MSGKQLQMKSGIFYVCLFVLLILRFPMVILPCYGLLPISKEAGLTIFEIGTYPLTALMILLKRDCLEKYHIDRLALGLLVFAPLGCFVTQGIFQSGWRELPLSTYVNAGFALLFLTALLIWRPDLPRRGGKTMWKWVVIAILVALCESVVWGYLVRIQRIIPSDMRIDLPKEAFRAFLLIFPQLSTAAAMEEPLFRGFLWGVLKDRGWKELWIWLFQALLFMLGHIYYLGINNYSFFLVVPLGALVLGLAAWKSRSIGTSILIHGISNSFGGNFFFLLWR